MLIALRWACACGLLLLCAWVVVVNANVLWTWYIRRRKAPSWIPLVGGVSGAIGILLLPLSDVHKWWWLPLVLDWGSLPGISHAIIYRFALGRR
jgi:hypothetical protein